MPEFFLLELENIANLGRCIRCQDDAQPEELPVVFGHLLPPGSKISFLGQPVITRTWRFEVMHCPFCGGQHLHSWPAPGESHREPQIVLGLCGGGEYLLKVKEEESG